MLFLLIFFISRFLRRFFIDFFIILRYSIQYKVRRTELVDSLKEIERESESCLCVLCVIHVCVCCLLDINNYNLQCKMAANEATKLQVLKLNI